MISACIKKGDTEYAKFKFLSRIALLAKMQIPRNKLKKVNVGN